MTQTIHFIRFILSFFVVSLPNQPKGRNLVSMVAIFVLPLVAAFLFINIDSARGAGTVIWDMEPDQGTSCCMYVGQTSSIESSAGYFETGFDPVTDLTIEVKARRVGSPADLNIQVWTDNGGVPGTPVSGWSIDVPNVHFTTSSQGSIATLILEGDTLATETSYWVTFDPGAVDSGNYYQFWTRNGNDPFPPTWTHGRARRESGTWTQWTTGQLAWRLTANEGYIDPGVYTTEQYESGGGVDHLL